MFASAVSLLDRPHLGKGSPEGASASLAAELVVEGAQADGERLEQELWSSLASSKFSLWLWVT